LHQTEPMPSLCSFAVVRIQTPESSWEVRDEAVIVEEPLQIRLNGETWASTLRTPGHDSELVAGLLFSEGLVRGAGDILQMGPCSRASPESRGNIVQVRLRGNVRPRVARLAATSACGVCGRESIDDLLDRCEPLPEGGEWGADALSKLVVELAGRQPLFRATGGSHAAGLVTRAGWQAVREDVGRHNAVDKAVGWALLSNGWCGNAGVLIVSGRCGFEVAQKAVMARIPVVVSISAPTSLAVEVARSANLTLAGFARDGRLTVYSCPERVTGCAKL